MIQKKCDQLLSTLNEELQILEQEPLTGLKKMTVCLVPVRRALQEIKAIVLRDGFSSQAEEIAFFRFGKPSFYALQIYYVECGSIEEHMPRGDPELKRIYIREQLLFIDRFIRQNAFLYQYYELGATELDHYLFVRGAQWPGILLPEFPDPDPGFSTNADYLFAKFMAYEQLKELLLELMSDREVAGESFVSKKGKALKWTGDTCNLIEVAYGIYDTLQINEGEVDLTDIIDWLEVSLNVNLSRFYRRFMEIKRRKVMSKTKYLDEMRAAVNKRIDDTDALQTEKRRSFRNH